MSLFQNLAEVYDNNVSKIADYNELSPLTPICHILQNVDVEICLDQNGNLRRAKAVRLRAIIPCTEDSGGRTCNVTPHPLCESLEYVAGDFEKYVPGKKEVKQKHEAYLELLSNWQKYSGNKKLNAVLSYVKKDCLIKDLVDQKVVTIDKGHIKTDKTKDRVLVCWVVEINGEVGGKLWQDKELFDSWIEYMMSTMKNRGLCMITGQETIIAQNHPRGIRYPKDGCKLITSNDTTNFTFRGELFRSAEEACTVGFEVSQKAHAALRWLIARKQGIRNDSQLTVVWSNTGKFIPSIISSTYDLFKELGQESDVDENAGQGFADKFKKYLLSCSSKLQLTDKIFVLIIDSIVQGRLSIQYYRELSGSEFIDRLKEWHSLLAWNQILIQKDQPIKRFVGAPWSTIICAPALYTILDVVLHGHEGQSARKLRQSTFRRLLSCIIDRVHIPADLVNLAVHKASRKVKNDPVWERSLGVACSLFKAYHKERGYQMSLEVDRNTRSYLFGRLLAVAEQIEGYALYLSGTLRRMTSAEKLMSAFSIQPASVWLQIMTRLSPYRRRLHSRKPGALANMDRLIDEIKCKFNSNDFNNDRLDPEFLLAYSCQRSRIWEEIEEKKKSANN